MYDDDGDDVIHSFNQQIIGECEGDVDRSTQVRQGQEGQAGKCVGR